MDNRFDILWDRILKEIPNAKLIERDKSKLIRFVNWILKNILRSNANYNNFATTIFSMVYAPAGFSKWYPDQKYKLMRHELAHLRQFRSWPFSFLNHKGIWWINAIIMSFCYAFVLPWRLGMRHRFEQEGYAQTILVKVELGELTKDSHYEINSFSNWLATLLSDGSYFYAWNSIDAFLWAMKTIHEALDGKLVNDKDRVDL